MLKLLRVLGLLLANGAGAPAELHKIAQDAGLPLSTTHRILQLCVSYGMAQQVPDHRYVVGPAMLGVGMSAAEGQGLRDLAQVALARLAATSREEAYLTMRIGHDGVFTARHRSPHPIRVVEPLFERLPLHCGASRKVLLAYVGDQFLADYLAERPLQRYTDRTITDPDTLRHELAGIVERGYAISDGERSTGVAGIAAPVIGPWGQVLSSVAILAPSDSILGERKDELISIVRRAAQDVADGLRIPEAWGIGDGGELAAEPVGPADEPDGAKALGAKARGSRKSGKSKGKVSGIR